MEEKKRVTTAEKKKRFLIALRKTGVVMRACEAAGCSRQNANKWRECNEKFSAAWETALQDKLDEYEEVVLQAGKEQTKDGAEMAFRILSRMRHKKWGNVEKLQHEHNIKPVVIQFGDNMEGGLAEEE